MFDLSEFYYKELFENERNLRFWEGYVEQLESLDINQFSKKFKVPVLVPIGSRILFRGELKHTNEITVALGANYFAKCSTDQAEVLRQHRIKEAKSKLDILKKEKKYLEDQVTFNKNNILEDSGKDIVEYQSLEEDDLWRQKHRENVRQYKQKQAKLPKIEESMVNDEELWTRLEELELQEELEEELLSMKGETTDSDMSILDKRTLSDNGENEAMREIENQKSNALTIKRQMPNTHTDLVNQSSKMELLQKVLEKQNVLEQKLNEMKNKAKSATTTENNVLSRLDEIEQLEELEDEMDRLDDVVNTEEVITENSSIGRIAGRNVSFADEDDSETIEISFTHSNVEPLSRPYNEATGITKPSDIYEAYAHLFTSTKSILKRSNYNIKQNKCLTHTLSQNNNIILDGENDNDITFQVNNNNKTIIIQDIAEKDVKTGNKIDILDTKKPMSLFKQKRLQKKL